MPHPNGDSTTWLWILGVLATAGAGLSKFFNSKINRVDDAKVEKDVFEMARSADAAAHKVTHDRLTEIKNSQGEIHRKLDSKQDKL